MITFVLSVACQDQFAHFESDAVSVGIQDNCKYVMSVISTDLVKDSIFVHVTDTVSDGRSDECSDFKPFRKSAIATDKAIYLESAARADPSPRSSPR